MRKKARKRINKNIPNKGILREHCDDLWSIAVRMDWDWVCAVCGREPVEAHHIVPREYEACRYELSNGIALCARCHKLGKDAPHVNAPAWMDWLKRNHPRLHKLAEDDPRPTFDGIKNWPYYVEHIKRLREYVDADSYEKIVGVRFAAWLEENNE